MASEAERGTSSTSPGDGDGPQRFLELPMGPGAGGREGEPFVFFPTIIGVMGPGGEEGGEAAAPTAERVVLVTGLGTLLLRAEGGGLELAAMVHDILFTADGAPVGPPPASKASIEAMRTVERPVATEAGAGGMGEEEECPVCLDGLWADEEEGEKRGAVKEMPCRHRFHAGCIERWLGLHGSCPVCRFRMPEEEQGSGKKGSEEGDVAARRQSAVEQQERQGQQEQEEQQQEQQGQQDQVMEEID